MMEDFYGPHPYMLTPLILAAQNVSIDKVGDEPDIMLTIKENIRTLGGVFESKGSDPVERKRLLADAKILASLRFDTEKIYTFEFYQHLFHFSDYKYVVNSLMTFDIAHVVGGQPLEFNCVVDPTFTKHFGRPTQFGRGNRKYLWRIEAWHKKLQRMNTIN
eukprot:Trichotokara_eunicae@DN2983_c0_g1_i1.p1